MKKKNIVGIISCLTLLSITGCAKNSENKQSSQTTSSSILSKESENDTSSVENKQTEKSSTQAVKNDTNHQQTTNNTKQSQQITTQTSSGQEYYVQIKKAWQNQKDYIDSITDEHIKQGVQTPEAAANLEASYLMKNHPEDTTTINDKLKKVLAGE
ncbi:MAG: hypothetical protein LBH89_02885 [Lactococcus lactis]|jgi:hypothetical protein|uniref:hypothetical protein n=1 Tax=Lactococcus lactis TaxID=1358 RepID=UPI00223A728E|nr:hypothetical protein [Lactococcus lactis]MCT0016919.1 hypothetical protein [Lactococcus lactis subsp. lactis]MDR0317386.1 hypothetical protein [Lactococcus lactis]